MNHLNKTDSEILGKVDIGIWLNNYEDREIFKGISFENQETFSEEIPDPIFKKELTEHKSMKEIKEAFKEAAKQRGSSGDGLSI